MRTLTLLFFSFLSLNLCGQNTTFESVFQVVKHGDTTEIYHTKIHVDIEPGLIELYTPNGESKMLFFSFAVKFQTTDNNTFYYKSGDEEAVFLMSQQRLHIKNNSLEWDIYGIIPYYIKITD